MLKVVFKFCRRFKLCRLLSLALYGLISKAEIYRGIHYLSLVVRKPDFCICENKDADQLRGNREADQRLCFRYTNSTILLLYKSEISGI